MVMTPESGAQDEDSEGPRRYRRGPSHGRAFCIRVAYSLVPVRATRQSSWEKRMACSLVTKRSNDRHSSGHPNVWYMRQGYPSRDPQNHHQGQYFGQPGMFQQV
jgi:hypothetical protein